MSYLFHHIAVLSECLYFENGELCLEETYLASSACSCDLLELSFPDVLTEAVTVERTWRIAQALVMLLQLQIPRLFLFGLVVPQL